MPLGYYPGMDDNDHASQLHTISPSVPPTDHEITIPPPFPDLPQMLPSPTTPTKKTGMEKEKDQSRVGGLLMDLAKDGSDDGCWAPVEKVAHIPPASTETAAGTIPQAPTRNVAG